MFRTDNNDLNFLRIWMKTSESNKCVREIRFEVMSYYSVVVCPYAI